MAKMDLNLLTRSEILNLKISDLQLDLPEGFLAIIRNCEKLLMQKDIKWRPYFWLSDEWCVPDGIAGIAIPFVLCHPKLIKLEKEMLGFCEGSTPAQFKKLYAHEIGHAIDNAFGLRRKKRRQILFGKTSKKYPQSYLPKPESKNFVQHLDDFYAQAHPDEDWAETFAVWLTQKSWRYKYRETPALIKLEYVDMTMRNSCQDLFYKLTWQFRYHYKSDHRTLAQYFADKRKMYGLNRKSYFKSHLSQIFSHQENLLSAHHFLLKNQNKIISKITDSGQYDAWIVKKCIEEMKQECKKSNYHLKYNLRATQNMIEKIIQNQYEVYIKKGRTKVYM